MKDIQITDTTKTKEGFELLYKSYSPGAVRTAIMILGNEHLAADAVQETFIRVYINLDKFDTTKPFKPWFYQILINECKRIAGKNKKIIYVDKFFENMLVEDDKNNERIEFEELYHMLGNLEQKIRTPLILKYLNDMKLDEISNLMKLNINTVKSRLHFGRKKLRTILANYYND